MSARATHRFGAQRSFARQNGFLGINWTKTQQYEAAVGKEAGEWARYETCCGTQIKKGKDFYHPQGPSYHPLALTTSKNCDGDYKDWLEAVGKLGDKAAALKTKREQQLKLTTAAASRLGSEVTASQGSLSQGAQVFLQSRTGTPQISQVSVSDQQLQQLPEELPIDEGTVEEGTGMSTTAKVGIGVAVVGLLAGAYFLLR